MKIRILIVFLCIISFVLSACSPITWQIGPTSTPIPTATPGPTDTPTVTPSPTPTLTPTPEPTRDFTGLHECRQWPEAILDCRVTLEDLTSGRLVDYAKSMLAPLPDSAFPAIPRIGNGFGTAYFYPKYVEYKILPVEFTSATNGEIVDSATPIDNRLWFLVQSENNDILPYDIMAMVVKIRTKNGNDGYYILVRPPDGNVGDALSTDQFSYWSGYSKTAIYPEPVYNPNEFFGAMNPDANWLYRYQSKLLKEIIEDTDGQRKKLMDEWISSGEVPIELEKIPLFAYALPAWLR